MRVSFLRGCEFDSRQQRVVLKFFEWMTAGSCSIHFFYAVYQNFCRVYTPNKFLPTVERNDLLPQLRPGTIYADVNHLSVLSVFSTRTPFREYLQLKIIIRRIFLRKNRSSFEIRVIYSPRLESFQRRGWLISSRALSYPFSPASQDT